jgi:hypothetical protein
MPTSKAGIKAQFEQILDQVPKKSNEMQNN